MSQADVIYRSKDEVLAQVFAAWQARIPDISLSPDTIARIWSEVFSDSAEGLYLAMQLLRDDIFIQTATLLALTQHGEQFGRPQKVGTLAEGSVRFSGAGGEFIATGSQVGASRPGLGDTLMFETTDDVTIPEPGLPGAPLTEVGSAGDLSGTIEHAVTFVTDEGETEIGEASDPVVYDSDEADLSDIPIGGPGTIGRKIYRRNNGGDWQFVGEIENNSTETFTDDVDDGSLGGPPPAESTAERVTVSAQATQAGLDHNVVAGTITEIVDVDADVNAVTNPDPFEGGSDPESIEEFRQELKEWVQAPQSGSPPDLVAWATSIEGVETATVFQNEDLAGDPAPGTVSVRIAGPGGTVPDGPKVAEVLEYLESKDVANVTILVGTFTPEVITVEVEIVLAPNFLLSDVENSVSQAAIDYINSVPVGATVYVAGIYHAIFALPGVATVTVIAPAADVPVDPDEKAVATLDDVTVTEA